jgi:hypothetical protein
MLEESSSNEERISELGRDIWFVRTLYVANPRRRRKRSALDGCFDAGVGATGVCSLACVVCVAHSAQSTKAEKLALLSCDCPVLLFMLSAGGVSGSVEDPRSQRTSRFWRYAISSGPGMAGADASLYKTLTYN